MNIVYLHQHFKTPSQYGGTRSFEFARRLVASGHTVHMVAAIREPNSDQRTWQHSTTEGIHVHAIPVPYNNKMSFRQRLTAFVRFAYLAAGQAAKLRPDLVFATSTPLTIALPGVYAARRCRVPMVFEVRDLWPEMPIAVGALRGRIPIMLARALERFAYRNAARVVALSPGMRDGVVETGYPADHVTVIPNSCDLDPFNVQPAARDAYRATLDFVGDRPIVTYAGTLGQLNGVGYLARIAQAFQEQGRDAAFVVAGGGKEGDDIKALAQNLGVLDRNFFMLGRLPKSEMPLLLAATDVATSLFIDLPEMWKNSANKFFDGLASSTPVAINYQGWQADLLAESGAGIVLPADDPAEAARLLAALLDNKQALDRAGQAARHLAETQFSRDLLYQAFEAVLLDAAREA